MSVENGIHKVNATEAQINYLNKVADTNKRYREACQHIIEMCQKELEGSYWGLSHQTIFELQKYKAQLDGLREAQWSVFADIEGDSEERQARKKEYIGWVKLALTENRDGFMGVNWFTLDNGSEK